MSFDADYYLKLTKQIALFCTDNCVNPDQYVLRKYDDKCQKIIDLIKIRSELFIEHEKRFIDSLIDIGLYCNLPLSDRGGIFQVIIDIEDNIRDIDIDRRCEKYNGDQPLFRQVPALMKHIRDGELIDIAILEQEKELPIFRYDRNRCRADYYLPVEVINFAKKNYANSKQYIRIDPYALKDFYFKQFIQEVVIRPSDPKKIVNLSYYKNEHDSFQCILQDTQSIDAYWEYHVKRIRKLEGYIKRYTNNRLSFSVEELQHLTSDNNILIGRYIHCDTSSLPQTSINKVMLDHLDLAVNYYYGDDSDKRLEESLSNGLTINASKRMHLFRIENIPFCALIIFAGFFFMSHILINEWISYQFKYTDGTKTE